MTHKRISYRSAINFIAEHDNPGVDEDPGTMTGYYSVLMFSALFDVDPIVIALDVYRRRHRPGEGKGAMQAKRVLDAFEAHSA